MEKYSEKIMTYFLNFILAIFFFPFYFCLTLIGFSIYKLLRLLSLTNKNSTLQANSLAVLDGLTIIIPTWNNHAKLAICLEKLQQFVFDCHHDFLIELIIVDNGSICPVKTLVENYLPKSKITVIRNDKNLSFAPAINQAAQKARFNYLYLLNDDMLITANTITALLKEFVSLQSKKKSFFALTSQINFFDSKAPRQESGLTKFIFRRGLIRAYHVLEPKKISRSQLSAYAGGGSSLINKDLFLKLGGYDYHTYRPLYGEDFDLSLIAAKLNFPTYFVSNSLVVHYHRSSTNKLKQNSDLIIERNLLLLLHKQMENWDTFFSHQFFYFFRLISHSNYLTYGIYLFLHYPSLFKQKIKFLKFKPEKNFF